LELPETRVGIAAGRRRSSCAVRRSEAVPIVAPPGNAVRPAPSRVTSTSRGSSRGGTQAMSSPGGSDVSMSFKECTARSTW
jgi:hypothetical protein